MECMLALCFSNTSNQTRGLAPRNIASEGGAAEALARLRWTLPLASAGALVNTALNSDDRNLAGRRLTMLDPQGTSE